MPKSTTAKTVNPEKTQRAIVNLLKQSGPTDAQALADRLQLSAMAVRQHLYQLQEQQLISYDLQPRPMGRPAKLWHLTKAADRLFPDGYAELAVGLIDSIRAAFGSAGLEKIIDIRTQQQLANYQNQIPAHLPLSEKLTILADIRTHEGYMAEHQDLGDGSFLFLENHCPVCAAASACPGLCDRELIIFQHILAAKVTRTEHIITGARRCAYRVEPR